MQLLASPHVKQVNWSVGCTVSSNMRAHITNKASAPKVIREAGDLGSNVNFWSALTFKKRFCYSGNGGSRKGGCMMATITCIFLYELNCAANGCFFLWAVWTSHTQNPLASKCDLICLTAAADSKHHPTATLTLQSVLCCYMYPYLV